MKVTIFGASNPQPGQPAYTDAHQLGVLLALAGHTIITGGYMGTMEAASRGASEAGGHVIGITCDEIEHWRPIRPNPWVIEERRQTTLQDRLSMLIDSCDAALALPGGPGTLAEISLMWNRLIISAIPPKPLILIGSGWQQTFSTFSSQHRTYLRQNDNQYLQFASTVEDACHLLQNSQLL